MRIIPPLGGGQWQFNPEIPTIVGDSDAVADNVTAVAEYFLVDGRGNCWPNLTATQVRELRGADFHLVGMGTVGVASSADSSEGVVYQVAAWSESSVLLNFGEPVVIRELQGKTPTQMQLYATANGLAAFHRRFKHCHCCAGRLVFAESGWARRCQECKEMVYPRQDPAVIVTIFDASERLLLAHNTAWSDNRVSLIAGFIHLGESAEQAVCREIAEEVGLNVSPEWVSYVTTQTWPFPQSFMLAYEVYLPADYQGLEPAPDGVEIDWARWFTRESFQAEVASGKVSGPVNHSVAAALVHAWLNTHMGTRPRV